MCVSPYISYTATSATESCATKHFLDLACLGIRAWVIRDTNDMSLPCENWVRVQYVVQPHEFEQGTRARVCSRFAYADTLPDGCCRQHIARSFIILSSSLEFLLVHDVVRCAFYVRKRGSLQSLVAYGNLLQVKESFAP